MRTSGPPFLPQRRRAHGLALAASAAFALVLTAAFLPSAPRAAADEITLTDGKVWEGKIVRETDQSVVLKTAGGELEILRASIAKVERKPTRAELYEEKLKIFDKDDADQQYLLGLWCKRNGLGKEAEYHLNRAIGLNPDHEGAHMALDHVKYNGKWMTEKEMKEAQGFVLYKGRWMTKDAAEAARLEDVKAQMKKEVARQVRALAELIAGPPDEKVKRRAVQQLLTFRDPLGNDAIIALIRHRSGEVREVALKAVDKLKIPGAEADVLRAALHDPEKAPRTQACRMLPRQWRDSMFEEVLKTLRGDDLQGRVAAAQVLGVVKNPLTIDPLIDALYVKFRTPSTEDEGAPSIGLGGRDANPNRQPPPGTRYDPGIDGLGISRNDPDSGWRPTDAPDNDGYAYLINYAALDALRAITAQDFGVNKRAWRKWWDENRDDFQPPKEK
jgi:hypothetical protein